jgi:hypothetical protein
MGEHEARDRPAAHPDVSGGGCEPYDTWDEFCEELRQAGRVLLRAGAPRDELTQAEGHRYLVRMIRAGFENAFDLADPLHPQLAPMVGPRLLYEGVTSDARYLHAFIDGRRCYRIRGTRGDAPLLELGVYTGKLGLHEKSHLIASLTEERLEVGPDGSIEVGIGPGPRPGNWLDSEGRARYMMIRQYAHDWSGLTPGRFAIEPEGGDPGRPPLGMEEIRRALRDTAAFLRSAPEFWASISDYWAERAPNQFLSQLEADRRTDVAPPSGHQFSCGYFRLEPDEALLVRLRPGEVPFWGLELANYWYETIGFGRPESHLNNRSAQREPDGSVRAVVSLRAPGVPNWVDPKGHREGTLIFRWSRSADPVPRIDTKLVPHAALPGALAAWGDA